MIEEIKKIDTNFDEAMFLSKVDYIFIMIDYLYNMID